MLKTQRSADLAAAGFLTALGIATVTASWGIPEGAGGQLHPRTFPLFLGTILILGGIALGMWTWRSKGVTKLLDWPEATGWKRWGLALVLMAAYIGLSAPAGFLLTSFLFVVAFIRLFGRHGWSLALSCAAGTTAFIYVLFVRLLDLTLPLGPLARLLE